MNILLCNLTRFGDLLQSQPLIHGLALRGHSIYLVCLENFVDAASLLHPLAGVYPFPASRLRAGIDSAWITALGTLEDWIAAVHRDCVPDLCINLTATLPARLLSRTLTAAFNAPVLGFGLDEFGFAANSSLWTTLLQASSLQRGCSPFNIVDLFRAAADCGQDPAENKLRPLVCENKAKDILPTDSVGYIAFQLGASEQVRQWPTDFFAALGDLCWEEKVCPVLLGTAAERELGVEYARLTHSPYCNLIGETDIPELAVVLAEAEGLVTNDTGTMHLAAGLGRPVLAIFLATAQAWDTGPYSLDACCLEPDLDCHPCDFGSQCSHEHCCKRHIQPAFVWNILRQRLKNGDWLATTEKNVRVWHPLPEANGFMNLEALSPHETQSRTAWIRLQRSFYRQLLEPDLDQDASQLPLYAANLAAEERQTLARALHSASELLDMFHQQGALLCLPDAPPLVRERFLRTSSRIAAHFAAFPRLAALSHLWNVAVQEQGHELDAVLRCTALFEDLSRRWSRVLEA